jgi:FkbM family methyltransferase
MLTGSNDFKVSRVVNALLSPGDVFLDIGANYSTIGLKAIGRVRPGGHVHLFEPQPTLADAVQAAIEAAGLQQQVTLHRLALYDRDGTMMMRVPTAHSGMATIAPQQQRDTSDWMTVAVCTRSARDCVSELTRGRRFGVKIDVEGAEPAILPGLLDVGKMMFCVFEGDRNQEKIFQMFKGAGYEVYGLCKTLRFSRLSIVNTLGDWSQFHDFLAVPADIRIDRQRFPLRVLAAAMQGRPADG